MNKIDVSESCPSRVGNAKQVVRQVSFRTCKRISTLNKQVVEVFKAAGKVLIATQLRKALISATILIMLVTSCNFPTTYETLSSPTAPQVVDATEAPRATSSAEPTMTPVPTETPSPYEPPTIYISETGQVSETAENPAFYNRLAKEDPIIGVDEDELALAKANQFFRIYIKQEGIKDHSFSWPNQEVYISEMEDFAQNHPGLEISQRQSPDNASILTFIYNKETREVLWGFDAQGNIAFPRPDFYDANTNFLGILLPEVTTPDYCYNLNDGHWYLFAVTDEGIADYVFLSHEANTENLDEQWKPLSSEVFLEIYKPRNETKYIFEKEGLEIPIYLSVDNKLYSKVEFKDIMVELMGEYWLRANHYRYQKTTGDSEMSLVEYIDLLEQGKGQVKAYYLDENDKVSYGYVDPRLGFSLLMTERDDLPLLLNPEVPKYPIHGDMRISGQGIPMVVRNTNHESFSMEAHDLLEYGLSEKTALYTMYFNSYLSMVSSWGRMTFEDLYAYADGRMPRLPHQTPKYFAEFLEPLSEFHNEYFKQLREVLSEEEYESLLGRTEDEDAFLIILDR
jgi:hypothetical protein